MIPTKRNSLFPQNIVIAAQAAAKLTECLASVTLAQWALESAWGARMSGKFNYFGIKHFPGSPYSYSTYRTQEQINGRWITVEAQFVNFPSVEEAFRFHGALIVNQKNVYAGAYEYRSNWRLFIPAMAKHYATDPDYANKLISLIEEWYLTDYDITGSSSPVVGG